MAGAVKVPIKFIVGGKYEPESFSVLTPIGEISKVRVMGRVVNKFVNQDRTYGSLTLDDGTETIRVKGFRDKVQLIEGIGLGDLVDVIGRVREFQEEIHIVADALMVYSDVKREMLRLLEIIEILNKQDPKKAVLEFIKQKGEARLEELEAEFGKETRMLLEELGLEGEIFEPKKGVFKIIE